MASIKGRPLSFIYLLRYKRLLLDLFKIVALLFVHGSQVSILRWAQQGGSSAWLLLGSLEQQLSSGSVTGTRWANVNRYQGMAVYILLML